MCLTEARTQYVYNAYIYSGNRSEGKILSEDEKKLSFLSQLVISLTKPLEGSRRNITADNWLSSIELVTEFGKRVLTYVETLRKK